MGTHNKEWIDAALNNLKQAKETVSNRNRRSQNAGGNQGRRCFICISEKEKTIGKQSQAEAFASFVDYAIRTQSLLDEISLPWIPNHGQRAILHTEPRHPGCGLDETQFKMVSEGVYVYTKLNSADKQTYAHILAGTVDLQVHFRGAW